MVKTSSRAKGFGFGLSLLGAMVLLRGEFGTAQIISQKKVGDKTVMCMHSGLMSDLVDCGAHADWYTFVFVGKIASVTAAGENEQQIQIVPEEVFAGDPHNPTTVVTSQGRCFPSLVVGESWLFYLRKGEENSIVLDYFGNDSLPLSQATERVDTLRRLKSVGNLGILRGTVVRGTSTEGMPISGARVIARRTGKTQFVAMTDATGRFEFQALPTGRYKVSATGGDLYRVGSKDIDVKGGECWDITLAKDRSLQDKH